MAKFNFDIFSFFLFCWKKIASASIPLCDFMCTYSNKKNAICKCLLKNIAIKIKFARF